MRTVAATAWLVVLCLENTLARNKQLECERARGRDPGNLVCHALVIWNQAGFQTRERWNRLECHQDYSGYKGEVASRGEVHQGQGHQQGGYREAPAEVMRPGLRYWRGQTSQRQEGWCQHWGGTG